MMQLTSNIALLKGLLIGKNQIHFEAASPEGACILKVFGGTLLSQTLSPRYTSHYILWSMEAATKVLLSRKAVFKSPSYSFQFLFGCYMNMSLSASLVLSLPFILGARQSLELPC